MRAPVPISKDDNDKDTKMNVNIAELLKSLPIKSHYVIDIGASVGAGVAHPILCDTAYTGVAIECNPNNRELLEKAIKNPKVNVHIGYATPDSIVSIFQKYNVPREPDMVKIDIDGYDLQVLRSVLSAYKPAVIYAEINEKIPPPIEFEILYNPSYAWDGSHCFGCSIAAADKVMTANNYAIVCIDGGNNILCIRKDYLSSNARDVHTIYNEDYKYNAARRSYFPWNADVNYWLDIAHPMLLKNEISQYFIERNPRGKPISPDAFDIRFS